MIDQDRWYEENDRYLSLALAWLRLRLESMGERVVDERQWPVPWITYPVSFGSRSNESTGERADTLPADDEIRKARDAMTAAETSEQTPALVLIRQRFSLSRFEQDTLLLSTAMALDTRIPSLCARAQDDPGKPYPTFALAMALFEEPAWDAMAPDHPLRSTRLLDVEYSNAQSLTTAAIRADERVISYIKGLNFLDERLSALLTSVDAEGVAGNLPPSQSATVDRICTELMLTRRSPVLVKLLGSDTPTKKMIAARVSSRFGLFLYSIPIQMLPTNPGEIDLLSRLWHRESMLLPIALYIDAREEDPAQSVAQGVSLGRLVSMGGGVIFLDALDQKHHAGLDEIAFEVAKPTPREQQEAWTAALGQRADGIPRILAEQFDLDLVTIQSVAGKMQGVPEGGVELENAVWNACKDATRPQIEGLARRIDPVATWNDIVLPERETKQLRQIADQVRMRPHVYESWGFRERMNRGLGICALFTGDSGTGKTMAAEVLANDLGLDLYRIDLSAVVSKYIGDTEKNIRRVMDGVEGCGVILFLDEADALAGKRSEVKDSHDRYANIEINYLLQRIEAYSGLAILATNMKSALDPAFMRRLRFVVRFPYPGPAERREIWKRAFTRETPLQGLDYDRLARLNLTGGSIHTVALNAAFLAAAAGQPVTMAPILEAARAEFQKLELPVNEADFVWPPGGKL